MAIKSHVSGYRTSVYLTANGTKLCINIDKQSGGQVTIQLHDTTGNVYFVRTLTSLETKARISLDLTDLADGRYVLSVSNGLDSILRDINITTQRPTIAPRSMTVL